jgi:hypothetical protein
MKKIILTGIVFIFFVPVFCQSTKDTSFHRPMNGILMNIAGNGSLFSMSYERLLATDKYGFITTNLGVGYTQQSQFCLWDDCPPPEVFTTYSGQTTVNAGGKTRLLETGFGCTYFKGSSHETFLFYPLIGLRIQPLKPNLNFRLYACYPVRSESAPVKISPIGISVGACF